MGWLMPALCQHSGTAAGAVRQCSPARAPTTGQAVHYEQDDDDASTAEAYNIFSVKFVQRTVVRRALDCSQMTAKSTTRGSGITVKVPDSMRAIWHFPPTHQREQGAGACARPTPFRRPGPLRRQRSLDRRGPVAGGPDEGASPQLAVTNCMKKAKNHRDFAREAQ